MNKTTQIELAQFSHVVDLIYQGAVDPYAWNATIPALADYMQASKAMLFTPTAFANNNGGNSGFYFNHAIPETAMELWRTRYQAEDIWLPGGIANNLMNEGCVWIGEEVAPRPKLIGTVWYQEFLSRIGIGQVLVNVVFGVGKPPQHLTVLSLFRSLDEPTFDAMDKYKSSLLLPHISRALGVLVRLRNAECQLATSFTALDKLSQGVLLLGENGEITFCNKAAQRILQHEDGLHLKSLNGSGNVRLIASNPDVQQRLNAAISEVVKPDIAKVQHFSKAVVIERPSGKASITLNFSAMPLVNDFAVSVHPPKAIAFICAGNANLHICHELLKTAYGLTKAEIHVAEMILTGHTLEEISAKNEASINTLKTHLKHIYAKTNTNNRVGLVKMLISVSGE